MLTKEIIDYIRSERALGATRENISAALRQAGWAEQDISDAFTAAIAPLPQAKPAAPLPSQLTNQAPVVSDIARRPNPYVERPVSQSIHNPRTNYQKTADRYEQHEKSNSLKGIGIILVTVAVGVGIWFYITKPDIPATLGTIEQRINGQKQSSKTPVDPLLVDIRTIRVPDAQNAARQPIFASEIASFKNMTTAEKDFLKKYTDVISSKNLPPLTQARTIVKKYDADITNIDQALALPYYQCLPTLGDTCPYVNTTIRTYAQLATLKAYVMSKEKTANAHADALTYALSLSSFGSKLSGNGDMMMTTIGLSIQKMGYSLAVIIKNAASTNVAATGSNTSTSTAITLTPAEKKAATDLINQNLTLFYRMQYTRDMSAIDFISNPQATTTVPLDQETRDELASLATYSTPINWRPEETRLYYARSYKAALDALALPCTGPEPKNSAYDTGFSDNAAVESDNYIGKLMFTNSYHSFETSFFTKRCELEKIIETL